MAKYTTNHIHANIHTCSIPRIVAEESSYVLQLHSFMHTYMGTCTHVCMYMCVCEAVSVVVTCEVG